MPLNSSIYNSFLSGETLIFWYLHLAIISFEGRNAKSAKKERKGEEGEGEGEGEGRGEESEGKV